MTPAERERYSRQILFEPIGEAGQRRLGEARVAIVGCGALGSFQAGALARAGVGSLRIIDRDFVEPSNLQRQWLFDEQDAGEALPKAVAAARKLATINREVKIDPRVADVGPDNAEELLDGVDLILDGADNFEVRFLVNEVAIKRSVPWVYGAAVGGGGVVLPVLPGTTACLACLLPEKLNDTGPTCDTAGILNVAAAAIAAAQVAEGLKILIGPPEAVSRRVLSLDLWGARASTVGVARDPDCPVCVQRRFERLESAGERRPAILCGRNAVQVQERPRTLDLERLKAALEPLGRVRSTEYALRFETDPYRLTIFPDGRAIIQGVDDIALARSLYARYVGV